MSHGRLVYLVGASGVGKDSLIAYLARDPTLGERLVVARRTITRALDLGSEGHEAVDHAAFAAIDRQGGFALTWSAGETRYGIRSELDHHLAAGRHVLVNGSRAALERVRAAYPELVVVLVTARPGTIRERLIERGREDGSAIEERLRRGEEHELAPGPGWIVIANDGRLADAAAELMAALREKLERSPCP